MSHQPNAKFQALVSQLSAKKIDFSKPLDHALFRDRAVLVTGGSGGIGSAIVRMFEEAGAYVVVADMDDRRGRQLEKEIGTQYGKDHVKYIRTDVTSWESQVNMFRSALSFVPSGAFDIVIICAGLSASVPAFMPEDPDSFHNKSDIPKAPDLRCVTVGVQGSLYTLELAAKYGMGLHKPCQNATPHPNGNFPQETTSAAFSKSIVIFGSLWGYTDCLVGVDYAAAKWALRGVFRSLRSPWNTRAGLRVNLVAPAWIKTPMTENSVEQVLKQGWEFGSMEDVTDVVARLAGDASINGRAVGVGPNGLYDLDDDMAGLDGAVQMHGVFQRGEIPVLEGFFY